MPQSTSVRDHELATRLAEAFEHQAATSEILRVMSRSRTDLQPVFDTIAASVVRLCAAEHSYVARFDGHLLHPVAFHGFSADALRMVSQRFPMRPSRENILGRVALRREVENLPDVLADPDYSREFALAGGWRSLLGVPMLRDGELIGAIGVGRTAVGAFPQPLVDLLKTFADQAVIAIENVRLLNELQTRSAELTRSIGQLEALSDVGQAVSSTLDLETVLSTIANRAIELAGMHAGAIYEYEEAREQFNLHTTDTVPDELVDALRSTPVRKGEGALGRLAVAAEPVQISDITDESLYRSSIREMLIRLGYRSLLAVPLLRENRLLGGLVVLRKTAGAFEPRVIDLMRAFATQSALAIQNARLFREIEEKGRQLESASRHKSQFLASMSHELRTPLNAILGFNEMILEEIYGDVPEGIREPLADMQASGKHLLRLINNVLDLAKIEAGRMELAMAEYSVQDVLESVRTTLRPLASEKGLEFVVSIPPDVPTAYGDPGRLIQCLVNLAGNSLKFTKVGRVEVSAELVGDWLVFRVTDTGIGIPPDKLPDLFTEFKQTDATIASEYGGSGLGLSITRKFVEMHGGRIHVDSQLGKGSSFVFTIPLLARATAAT